MRRRAVRPEAVSSPRKGEQYVILSFTQGAQTTPTLYADMSRGSPIHDVTVGAIAQVTGGLRSLHDITYVPVQIVGGVSGYIMLWHFSERYMVRL